MTQDTEATEEFCRIFDKFFDLFNTRSVTECIRKRKPDLMPYYRANDIRLKVYNHYSCIYVNISIIATVVKRNLSSIPA